MFEILCTGEGVSVWGGVFVVIVIIGTIIHVMSRRKGPGIAMCQIFILDGDRSGNFVRIENAIAEAKSKGAELICFPEATMLGWLNADAHSRACTIPGPDSEQLCELAKKYGVYLCIGVEEFELGRLFNSALLIDNRGRILLKHRQVNIPQKLMSPPYSAGSESDIATVNTKFGKIGLLICADTHREDLLDLVAALKPNLLLAPYGYAEEELKWPAHGEEFHNVVINAAKRTGAAVIGTNPVGRISRGPWGGRVYGGNSIAVDKTGNIIDKAKDRDRDVKIVSITTIR
jgi:N-carbamoylputrescine amidase